MLMAHPAVLRNLVERYAALGAADQADATVRRQIEDTAYTLCVSTGTRRVEDALAAAEELLRRAEALGAAA
ncbi:DUF5133 domain-containing protein [Streptomyces sp. NPDC049577]|uniref:DUF5133 domain-containing protein n=1 Tax=Streptomyces sp. NPDC049577 TaxID=3155153 RepID=UPI0034369363